VKTIGLRARLSLFYSALFTVLVAILFLGAYYLLKSDLENLTTDELVDRATALRGYIHVEADLPVLRYDSKDPEVAGFIGTATRYFQLYDQESGRLVFQSPELERLGLEFTPGELRNIEEGPPLLDVGTDEGRIRFYSDRITSDAGHEFFVQVGETLEPADAALRRFRRMGFLLLPVGLLLGGTAGFFMAGRALSPIRAMARTAQAIELTQLDSRLELTGASDEIDTLAVTFNDMLDRLGKAVGEMKQFTTSIAHELRTPLTALRGETEMALASAQTPEAYRSVLASHLEEFDKLTRIVNQLLVLARADSGELQLELEVFDLVPMIRNLVDTFALIAADKQIALDVEAPEVLELSGDPQWLERVLVNLLDNAIKYTPENGRVTLKAAQDARESRIEVVDTGCGIPEWAIPHIFERFFRVDPNRAKDIPGVGLGLTLVKWIIDKHRGSIEVLSHEGQSTAFVLHLPRDPGEQRAKVKETAD